MSLTIQKTQLEKDLLEKDMSILRSTEALHHAATVINNENEKFWSLPTDRLLDVLNYNIEQTLSIFEANAQAATVINSLLDLVNDPKYTNRAPIVPKRLDIVFENGIFVYKDTENDPNS